MSRGTQTSVKAKDVLKIILEKADDNAINALISHTGLQFLYPYQGLQWVVYLGNGLAKCILEVNSKGNISFDPNKIADIRYVEPTVDDVTDKADEKIRKDMRPLAKEEVSRLLAVGESLRDEDGAITTGKPETVSIPLKKETIKKPLAKGLI
ncbi:MAG: hypothetical protein QQN63_08730 [Nitrosopumilus sp.]